MTTFQDFLEKQAQRQGQKARAARRQEWIAAVDRLVGQLRMWLAESDPKHLLNVVQFEIERAEPDLGSYNISSLKIGLGDNAVEVTPVGRDAVGIVGAHSDNGVRAEGRVDITDGARKFILYRTLSGGEERWHALDERFHAEPFDKHRLECILQDLLS
jgi:hypothetical protein